MRRELALAGIVALVFGLGSFYATDHFGAFSAANLVAGALALGAAALAGARHLGTAGGARARPVLLRGLAAIAVSLIAALGLERLASRSQVKFDWTYERSFSLSPAVSKALAELDRPLRATLFADPLDPRKRRTRLLLETLADYGPVEVVVRAPDAYPELVDRFAIGSSNTVVLELGDRFEAVERPNEGTLFEALYRLRGAEGGTLAFLRGEGEGDPQRSDELGYSGFAAALETEGYELAGLVTAATDDVPEAVRAVLLVAPRRRLREEAVAAIARYLERGGSLVALLEPGVETGVEPLLERYGIRAGEGVVFDPASGPIEGYPKGIGLVAYNYEAHPITRGLDRNRMTFFPGARPFAVRNPQPGDEVRAIVWSSPRAWVADVSALDPARDGGVVTENGVGSGYQYIAAAGRYPRTGAEARIVVFGDADFASNRSLRSLYNLDVAMNAVHWAVKREPEITQRPKIRTTVQFPLPLENTLRTLYGVGLLVPEILLIAGGVVWLRRRGA